jgi:hypothetical protein
MRASDIIKMQMNQAFRKDAQQNNTYVPYKYREQPANIIAYNNTQRATSVNNTPFIRPVQNSGATDYQNKDTAKAVCKENIVYTIGGGDVASKYDRPALPDASGKAVPAGVLTELRARERKIGDTDCSQNSTASFYVDKELSESLCNSSKVATTFGGKNASDMRYVVMKTDSSGKMVNYIQYPYFKDSSGKAVPASVITEKHAYEIMTSCMQDNNTDISNNIIRPHTTYFTNIDPATNILSEYNINAKYAKVDCDDLNIFQYINFEDAQPVRDAIKITPINYNAVVDCSGQCTQGT